MVESNSVQITSLPSSSQPPEPPPPVEWGPIEERVYRVAQAKINAEKWATGLGAVSFCSFMAAVGGAIAVRIGLLGELRLVSLGYKLMAGSLLVLGCGMNRALAANKKRSDAIRKLKNKIKDEFENRKGEGFRKEDQKKLDAFYKDHGALCPSVLRYMKTPNKLDWRVRKECSDLAEKRNDKRRYCRYATVALCLSGIFLAGVGVSLYRAQGVSLGLSYGFGGTICWFVIGSYSYNHYRAVQWEVRSRCQLANEAARCDINILDALPKAAVTRIPCTMELKQCAPFHYLREVTLNALPKERESMPRCLRTLTLKGDQRTLRSLPPRLRHLSIDGAYHPDARESLSHLNELTTITLQRGGGAALESLATLPSLRSLQIDHLETLHHPLFRHLIKVTTDAMPDATQGGVTNNQAGFEKIVLNHPTQFCLVRIALLSTIQSATLKEDPGLTKQDLKALLVLGELTYLKIKNWKNLGKVAHDVFRSFWNDHEIRLNGKTLQDDQLESVVTCKTPATLEIRRS